MSLADDIKKAKTSAEVIALIQSSSEINMVKRTIILRSLNSLNTSTPEAIPDIIDKYGINSKIKELSKEANRAGPANPNRKVEILSNSSTVAAVTPSSAAAPALVPSNTIGTGPNPAPSHQHDALIKEIEDAKSNIEKYYDLSYYKSVYEWARDRVRYSDVLDFPNIINSLEEVASLAKGKIDKIEALERERLYRKKVYAIYSEYAKVVPYTEEPLETVIQKQRNDILELQLQKLRLEKEIADLELNKSQLMGEHSNSRKPKN